MKIACNIFIFYFVLVTPIQIPVINNATFVAMSNSSTTIMTNKTCNECVCMSNSSYIALNCFPNDTCEFFHTFPRTYQIQSSSQVRLYFLQQIFPNASQCCMSNTSHILNQIHTVTPIYANVSGPRFLVFDNHGYLVTISRNAKTIVRFDPTNLTEITTSSTPPTFTKNPMAIGYYNEMYFIGFDKFILAIDSNNFTTTYNISASDLDGTRDIMFLNNGETMVATSASNHYLIFFNLTNNVPGNYNFAYKQSVNYTFPHGFWYVNDTYFYVISWGNNTIYSYSAMNNSILWKEELFLNPNSFVSSSDGNYLTIDECNRYWLSMGAYGILIFDSQGSLLGNTTLVTSYAFYTLVIDNYLIYVSDPVSNQIIRLDLNIQC